MSAAQTIASLLREVEVPGIGEAFRVRGVPDREDCWIGRGPEGSLVLLLPADADSPGSIDIRLQYLRTRLRAKVRVSEDSGPPREVRVAIVEVTGKAALQEELFAGVVAVVLESLSSGGRKRSTREAVSDLVDLFQPEKAMRGTVLGLWGELVTILQSDDPVAMAEAWHVEANSKFDFALEGQRYEVKTTQGASRVHEFDLLQLHHSSSLQARVVSIVTTRTGAGTSLLELIDELQVQLTNRPDLGGKVYALVSDILGSDWFEEASEYRWDRVEAEQELRVIECRSVPTLAEGLPDHVLAVKLRVDCSRLPCVDDDKYFRRQSSSRPLRP